MSLESTLALPRTAIDEAADRRAHPRIQSAKLPVIKIRIPNRPAVTLVDLSSGGALLNLPFPVRPESRFPLYIETPTEPVIVPFQLIRCYVSTLRGGISYHAAGAFDSLLDLQVLSQRSSGAVPRLLEMLDRMHRGVQKAAARSRSNSAFNEILAATIVWLRRGESLDLVALKIKTHLTESYPSLMIVPSLLPTRDEFNSVACFGLTLRSRHALSAHDRRVLKANAQLISMLEDTRRALREGCEPPAASPMAHITPGEVAHTPAEWIEMTSQTRPAAGPVVNVDRLSSVKARRHDRPRSGEAVRDYAGQIGLRSLFESAMFQPATI